MSTLINQAAASRRQVWGAVASMAMCAAMLIASEFMPVSLLTPIASDLRASVGMAGQAISISGLFAVMTSLLIPSVASRLNRRYVLAALAALMLVSLVLIAEAGSFATLMVARALLGIAVGGFWSLATATIMQLVPEESVPKALGGLYTGNAVATAFAAPIGSYLGSVIGWRGVFWALSPIVVVNLVLLLTTVPSMPERTQQPSGNVLSLLRRPHVAFAMLAVMLTFGGAFAVFTYFRPFFETYTHADASELSFLLLGMGLAGFAGTYGASAVVNKRLYRLMMGMPVALAGVTLALLPAGHNLWAVAILVIVWGAINAAIPVAWSTWLSKAVRDKPESGGGLMVASIQLSIMLGAELGGALIDHFSIGAAFIGGVALMLFSAIIIGSGKRIQPDT
ncbi:putative MFS family arabinose efflux permease [Paraburkholderia youngii]|uniref:Putative MFS family arabinose efflux permease n=1 Tax=Paraburkholderia atlantica TaxID=2654982 RepID=A0A7W8Q3I8_PARAM|nr:MFS transporter [Paraburkholderia atlantica]MBB5422579.1 putative MFS family arabinose efflux permease [Paraburkholderia atlantica]